jgi:DNA helicase-2/ATP-dependent DNA helicase PcrA
MLSEVSEDGLTGPQREAVEHPGPRLLARGVGGSGKTRVVQERFVQLVAGGLAPERIVVLVPSTARAVALRARLQVRLRGGYEQLVVLTPAELAARMVRGRSAPGWPAPVLGPGERLALLRDRIDELSLRHHDFGGRPDALLASFVRRIDRLKGELIDAERYGRWAAALDEAADPDVALEREFASIYSDHERLLAQAGARDAVRTAARRSTICSSTTLRSSIAPRRSSRSHSARRR